MLVCILKISPADFRDHPFFVCDLESVPPILIQKFEISLNVKVMGCNPGYLLKSFNFNSYRLEYD